MIYIVFAVISILVAFLVSRFMVKKRIWAANPNRMCIDRTSAEEIIAMKEVAKKVLENDQDVWRASKYKISKTLENGTYVSVKVEERGTKVFAWPENKNIAFKVYDDNWSEKGAITLFTIIYGVMAVCISWLILTAIVI